MGTIDHVLGQREMSRENSKPKGGLRRARAEFGAVLGVLAFVLVVTFVTSPSTGHAAFPGANGKIAFGSNRDGNYEIYVMNADGSSQTRLTNNPAFDGLPAWSADGTKIAFQSDRDGNTEIYVMNADGSGQTRLTNNSAADECPAWSPDGTKIAFLSQRDGNGEVYVMNANGSGPTNLTNNPAGEGCPAWSPDGSKIAFSRDVGACCGRLDIFVMNSDGSGQTPLISSPLHDQEPNWSPDGSRITFGSDRAAIFNVDIYVANADGSGQTRLTNTGLERSPRWSPDGTKIAFFSERDAPGAKNDIYVMNADGSGVTRLTDGPADNRSPDWQPLPIPVEIDIKPGSFPNSINPKSKGVIPVAILTTGTFDATTVDPTTVLFGKTGTEAGPVHSALEDVDGDGDTDMILHFNTQATGIQCGDTSASLTGETFGGQAIEGSDSIKTVPCK